MPKVGSLVLQRITGCSVDMATAVQQAVDYLMKFIRENNPGPGEYWHIYWAPECYIHPESGKASLFKAEIALTVQNQPGEAPPNNQLQWFAHEIVTTAERSDFALQEAVQQHTRLLIQHGLDESTGKSLSICYPYREGNGPGEVRCSLWMFYCAEQEINMENI